MSAHPPRPRLVVRVGITGHRWNKLRRSDAEALRQRIRDVLDQIETITRGIGNDPRSGYCNPGPPGSSALTLELRLVSALAEGADRLLVEAAPAGWRLQAILPFPVEIYSRDFTESGSERELTTLLERAGKEAGVLILDGDRSAPNAFGPVGTAVCLNSDVLIAIWDGLPGLPGGTGEVVELATRVGIPVLHIAPDGARATSLDRPEQAEDEIDEAGAEGELGGQLTPLDRSLRRLLMPPKPPRDADAEELHAWHRLNLREKYFAEEHRAWQRGRFYGFVLRLLSFRWKTLGAWAGALWRGGLPLPRRAPADYGDAIRRRWTKKWKEDLGLSGEWVDGLLGSTLPEHYGWASYLASYYAGRYRNSFLWGYLLSWMAVLLGAAGGLITSALLRFPGSTLLAAAGEVAILLTILYLVASARLGKFHERWLAYRSLTEGFRSLTYTLPVARASTLDASGGSGSESWLDWLHRAIVREVGGVRAAMTPAHLQDARKLLLNDVLREQIEYHGQTAATLAQVDRRLHRWTEILFYAAVFIAGYHLVHVIKAISHSDTEPLHRRMLALGVVALTIPAAAAAAHGFLSQGEFESSADRSRRTRRQLERLRRRGEEVALTSAALGEVASDTARAMHGELGAWFAAYSTKGVNYP